MAAIPFLQNQSPLHGQNGIPRKPGQPQPHRNRNQNRNLPGSVNLSLRIQPDRQRRIPYTHRTRSSLHHGISHNLPVSGWRILQMATRRKRRLSLCSTSLCRTGKRIHATSPHSDTHCPDRNKTSRQRSEHLSGKTIHRSAPAKQRLPFQTASL